MWSLADDHGVDAAIGSLTNGVSVCSGASADGPMPSSAIAGEWRSHDFASRFMRELARSIRQRCCVHIRAAAQAYVNGFVPCESRRGLQAQLAGQKRIVSELGVDVERQMRGVNGDVVAHECRVTLVSEAGNWLQPTPEHAVMNEQHLGSSGDCFANDMKREIDRRCDATDITPARELESVQCG